MEKLFKVIHNVTTGEIEQVDLTADEIAIIKADEAAVVVEEEAKAKKEADRAALLARLGITEEEAVLLLGGTN